MAKWIERSGVGAAGSMGGGTTPTALHLSFSGSLAVQGSAYNGALVATGGVTPYAFSISVGALPTGLSLDAGTGAITGTPSAIGVFAFTGKVTDNVSTIATIPCTITVTQTALGNFTIGTITYAWGTGAEA